MENSKKKRSEVKSDGRISGKKTRSKKERSNGVETTEDAELEEFLTIINRLQAGFSYFKEKGGKDGAGKAAVIPPATESGLWNPAFELDDFKHGLVKISTGDSPQNHAVVGFDLNADPVSDLKSD